MSQYIHPPQRSALLASTLAAITLLPSAAQNQAAPQTLAAAPEPVVRLTLPHSYNPLNTYRPTPAAPANLANSPRIDALIHDGVLELSLQQAIALALENNLDIDIARYNIPIAATDVERTRAGGVTRGVNTGVVQNTPGGGVGGFGSGSTGAGAGGTSGGVGGAGTGASGLVQSTLGSGTAVSSYDPSIQGSIGLNHTTEPLSDIAVYGVPTLRYNEWQGNINYVQAFPTGTSLSFGYASDRETTNSPYTFLNPEIDSSYTFSLQQQLLAGFGLGPNLRYLRIAKNNQKISDQAFQLQVISTVTQVANMYWDLVSAYEDERVKNDSLAFANQTLDSAHKQLDLQAIPALDVTKDEGEVAKAEQELAIAKSTLQFQELLIKNALTKNLDDPTLEEMPVRPTDISAVSASAAAFTASAPAEDLVAEALKNRVELSISAINLKNRNISRDAINNALLPSLALVGNYQGAGLAGLSNPLANEPSTVPIGYGGALLNTFNNTAPSYNVGLSLNIPIRNRQAKADQYRSELETRQAQLLIEEQKKQIRIEVRNAQYSLEQSQARVVAAEKARDLSQKIFDITAKEQQLGAGSALQTLSARHDLATSESALVAARTAYQKQRVELDRAVGRTLEANSISIESARNGVSNMPVAQQ
jgi:outer membrane protein TolC